MDITNQPRPRGRPPGASRTGRGNGRGERGGTGRSGRGTSGTPLTSENIESIIAESRGNATGNTSISGDTNVADVTSNSRDFMNSIGMPANRTDADFATGFNQVDDVNNNALLSTLKSVYGVTDKDALITKLRVQLGLEKAHIYPFEKYRQSSYIHNLTTNHYPNWGRYVIPIIGNNNSTL
jgi:hypothetical protein